MACGVPLVTSQRVGATELLPRPLYDALPATPSAENIRAQLAELICNADTRATRAEQLLTQATVNTADANFEQTRAIYESAAL
jgi:hypothetical protein